MSNLEQKAEEWAKNCIHQRGNPHWHDLRDAYLAGARLYAKKCEEMESEKEIWGNEFSAVIIVKEENAKLRAALEKISNYIEVPDVTGHWSLICANAKKIAREALR